MTREHPTHIAVAPKCLSMIDLPQNLLFDLSINLINRDYPIHPPENIPAPLFHIHPTRHDVSFQLREPPTKLFDQWRFSHSALSFPTIFFGVIIRLLP